MAFSDLFVFGDSFMYGEETYQHHFEQKHFLRSVAKAIGRKELLLDQMGIPSPDFNNKERNIYLKFISDIKTHPDTPRPDYYSVGNLLAKELDIPCYNFAMNGNSNNTIFKDFLDQLDIINENSIVIVGVTEPNRKSYYSMHLEKENKVKNYSTSCWSHIQGNKDFQKYRDLDFVFGDDTTAQVLQTYAYISTMKTLANEKGCDNIFFIDPFNYFCPNKYHPNIPWHFIKEKSLDVDLLEEYAHHNLLEKLKQELHKLFIKGFSYVFEPVQSENLSVQCLNGHYSKYTYEKYTKDILLPLVTSR